MDGSDEYLRDVLLPADFFHVRKYSPSLFFFAPERECSPQGGERESAIAGTGSRLLHCSDSVGVLAALGIGKAKVEVSGEEVRIQFDVSLSLRDGFVVTAG